MSNTGIPGTDETLIVEIDLESYQRLMRVNVAGTFYVTRTTSQQLAKTAENLILVESLTDTTLARGN